MAVNQVNDRVTRPRGAVLPGGHAHVDAQRRALDRFFESYYRLRPVSATCIGVHDFDDRLPDWSPEGLSAARREMCELRRELAAAGLGVLDDDALRTRDWLAIDGALADAFLEIELMELDTLHFQRGNLSLALREAVFGLLSLMTRPFGDIENRGASLATRLRAFPLFLVGVRRTLEDVSLPRAWQDRITRECAGGAALLAEVEAWLEAEGAPASIRADARVGLAVARESLDWFVSFVRGLPASAETRYAAGPLLDLLVRRGHWLEIPPDALRQEAYESFELERERLQQRIRAAGAADWWAVRAQLEDRHPPWNALPRALQQAWEECRAVADAKGLVSWPEPAVCYQPLPPWMRGVAADLPDTGYRTPAPFDTPRASHYFVPDDRGEPIGPAAEAMRSTWNESAIRLHHVAHRGAIGHHLQNCRARHATSRIGSLSAVDCAARIAMFCGGTMAEGWASYATGLLAGTDFLSPLDELALLHDRVRTAARTVVDVELHGGRMRFDNAIRFYVERACLTAGEARAEAVRHSMFPGTAMSNWLGEREIRRLRARMEKSLGPRFSPRRFHDELLGFGSIPVSLAARLMEAAPDVRDANGHALAD